MPWGFIASLPFTVWSIWTQAFRLKSWCVFCLVVLVTLWVGNIVNLCAGNYCNWSFLYSRWTLACAYIGIYIFAIISTHIIIDIWRCCQSTTHLSYQLNRFRSDAAIFEAKLNESSIHEWSANISPFVLAEGCSQKPTITVISNLFCQPCARLHPRLKALRDAGFRIQYVLTAFNELLFTANEQIAAFAEEYTDEALWELLNEWFIEGREHPKEFWKLKLIVLTKEAQQRVVSQLKWCQEQQFYTTPTILINNNLLPDLYEVEDILQIYST